MQTVQQFGAVQFCWKRHDECVASGSHASLDQKIRHSMYRTQCVPGVWVHFPLVGGCVCGNRFFVFLIKKSSIVKQNVSGRPTSANTPDSHGWLFSMMFVVPVTIYNACHPVAKQPAFARSQLSTRTAKNRFTRNPGWLVGWLVEDIEDSHLPSLSL